MTNEISRRWNRTASAGLSRATSGTCCVGSKLLHINAICRRDLSPYSPDQSPALPALNAKRCNNSPAARNMISPGTIVDRYCGYIVLQCLCLAGFILAAVLPNNVTAS